MTSYSYDTVGNLDTTINDSATTSTSDDLKHDYGYDDLNRLTSLLVTRGTSTLFSQTYTLAADGQRESSTETSGGVTTFTDWEYDAWNRLVSEFRDVGNGSNGNPAGANHNVPNSTGDYYTTYSMDLVGNRLTKTVDDYTNSKDETITNRYVFASGDTIGGQPIDNALIGKVSGNDWLLGTSTTLGSGSTSRYEYDLNGSTIGVYTGSSSVKYTWDLRNRMVGYDANGDGDTDDTGDATFSYDHDNVQVKRVEVDTANGNKTTEYLQDTDNPTGYSQVLEEKVGTTLRSYIIGQSVLGQKDSNGTRQFISDGHGSTRLLIDPSTGTVLQSYDYDAYGNGSWSGTLQTPILYSNQLFDSIVNQYVLRQRYYNQVLGSFSSFDPQENSTNEPQHLHKYLYCTDNPIYFMDPSGFDEDVITLNASNYIRFTLMTIGLGFGAHLLSNALSRASAVNLGGAVQNLLTDLVASGNSAAAALSGSILSKTKDVVDAIDDAISKAISAGRSTLQQLNKYHIFPVIKSLGPKVYALDVAALKANPAWFVLNYNGPWSPRTAANRAVVMANPANIAMMVAASPGDSLDEFPYASTWQGGIGAMAAPVPLNQNLVQGGLLSAFYRYSLRGTAGTPFLVVPLNI